jgi:hypothetical protein
MSHIVFYERC